MTKIEGISKRDKTFPLYRTTRDGQILNPNEAFTFLDYNIRGIPKFLTTNIFDALIPDSGEVGVDVDGLRDVPVRPGFDKQWVEARVPERSGMALSPDTPASARLRYGAAIRYYDDLVPPLSDSSNLRELMDGEDDAEGLLEMLVFDSHDVGGAIQAKDAHYKGNIYYVLNDVGAICGDQAAVLGLAPVYYTRPHVTEDFRKRVRKDLNNVARMFLYAFGLINCKNTEVHEQEYTPSPAQRRHQKLKISDVPIKYHILTLDVPGERKKSESEGGGGGRKSLHICRGHFRTYTEEAPLFGQHTGTFWIPAHTRGSADKGVVLKDYEEQTA